MNWYSVLVDIESKRFLASERNAFDKPIFEKVNEP